MMHGQKNIKLNNGVYYKIESTEHSRSVYNKVKNIASVPFCNRDYVYTSVCCLNMICKVTVRTDKARAIEECSDSTWCETRCHLSVSANIFDTARKWQAFKSAREQEYNDNVKFKAKPLNIFIFLQNKDV